MRPASDSDDCRIRLGEALPSTRNAAGRGRRSASTRSIGNRSGRRWISSRTTRPRNSPKTSIGSSSRRPRSAGCSRSSRCVGSGQSSATCCANVVLPICRGPRIATTGKASSRSRTARTWSERGIDMVAPYHEKSVVGAGISSFLNDRTGALIANPYPSGKRDAPSLMSCQLSSVSFPSTR